MTVKSFNGPWTYAPKKTFPSGYENESEAIVDSNGNIVLMFDPSMGEYEPALAYDSPNLSLILAAPDLLDALKTIIEVIGNTEYGEIDRKLAVKDARAAIAKATGKDT